MRCVGVCDRKDTRGERKRVLLLLLFNGTITYNVRQRGAYVCFEIGLLAVPSFRQSISKTGTDAAAGPHAAHKEFTVKVPRLTTRRLNKTNM